MPTLTLLVSGNPSNHHSCHGDFIITMTTLKTFSRFLSDRPDVNHTNDNKEFGMNDDEKRRQRNRTLYESNATNTKTGNVLDLQTLSHDSKMSLTQFNEKENFLPKRWSLGVFNIHHSKVFPFV